MRTITELLDILNPGDAVLLRCDLNVPLQHGSITDTNRIESSLATIQALQKAGARTVLMTHLGRPDGTDPQLTTSVVARSLQGFLQSSVIHVDEMPPGPRVQSQLADLPASGILMLDNLRFDRGEESNDPILAAALAAGCRYFVNDAFGCCHRTHASVAAVTRFLPSFAGFLLTREIEVLSELRDQPERPFWIIAGGSKVRDKIGILAHLSGQLDGVVCGGGLANTLLEGAGVPVGLSRTEPEALAEITQHLEQGPEMLLPIDFIAGDDLNDPTRTQNIVAGQEPDSGMMLLDIGPKSVELFCRRLESARTIFWNGPLGVFETEQFSAGTKAIARMLGNHPGKVVIGGGDSAAAARLFGVADSVLHVSTGGGAALQFLEGSTLPGIAALIKNSEGDVR
ncbi:MAG: phosphoglycerate kinase [Planctomycetota bacterium]|nr:phosphoglycerate kinase [Planctomycetota bacterium]